MFLLKIKEDFGSIEYLIAIINIKSYLYGSVTCMIDLIFTILSTWYGTPFDIYFKKMPNVEVKVRKMLFA